MIFERLHIPEVILVTPKRHKDERGFFSETYQHERYAAAGITCKFVQDNHSLSTEAGTLRGLHYQAPPKAQHKLVRCTRGRIFDVAVDIRMQSPTFKQYVSVELSAASGQQLYVPSGFAHGFLTLEPNTEVQYKVSDYYDPELDRGIAYNDAEIGVDWKFDVERIITSQKDNALPRLSDLDVLF